MKKWIIIIGITLLLFMAIVLKYQAKQKNGKDAAESDRAVAVDVAKPEKKDIQQFVEIFGSLSPKKSTDVKSEIPGRIKTIRVKEWDNVTPSSVLLEIDPSDLKLEVNRNEAGVKMSRAQKLEAKTAFARSSREWERTEKLKKAGLVTGQESDERKTDLEAAEARLALADAQESQAEVLLAESVRNLGKARVCSPITGTVSERMVNDGDWVDKGTPLFTVVDNRILDLTANVPATAFPDVREGQNLTFTVDGLPEKIFTGIVKRLNPVVNQADRSGRIQAEVKNPESVLRGGIFARGKIVIGEKKQALTVPKIALMSFDAEKGTAQVFVAEKNVTATLKKVTTGLSGGEFMEILSGINENDLVVTRGGFNIKDGARITVNRGQAE